MALNTVSSDRLSTNVKNTNFTAAEKQDLTDDIKPLLGSSGGGNKNLIINGAMQCAQYGSSSTTSGYGSVDRFAIVYDNTDEAPTHAQANVASGTTPYTLGFRKCLKVTNGNQTSGAGANDGILIQHRLEGQDVTGSGWNYLSSSSNITLSFWVKSSVAQTFYAYLRTKDGTNYHYPISFALSANTWTKVTKTIPGNSNLTFNNDNGEGMQLTFMLFYGTNYTDSGVNLNEWRATSSGNVYSPDNTTTWYTTNDATFEITGVQVEVGSVATPFEHKSLTEELSRCHRYFIKTDLSSHCTAYFGGTHLFRQIQFVCPTPMRASPSFSCTGHESGGSPKFTLKTWSSDQNNTTSSAIHMHHRDYIHGTSDSAVYSVALGIDFSSGNSGIPPNGPGNHNVYACRIYGANLDSEL